MPIVPGEAVAHQKKKQKMGIFTLFRINRLQIEDLNGGLFCSSKIKYLQVPIFRKSACKSLIVPTPYVDLARNLKTK